MTEEDLVAIGKILREWGLKGELLVLPLTFDSSRFKQLKRVAIESKIEARLEWKKLKSVRTHKDMLLIHIDGCENPEEAQKYRGGLIKIKRTDSPELPEGVYYQHQIIGLDVYTVEGNYLGQLKSILETGSNDVYVVRNGSEEHLIPAIEDVITEIDLKSKKMVVKLMETVEE